MKQIYDLDNGKPFNCTITGFDIYWATGGRIIAIGRNRWQGSRDQVKLTLTERMSYEQAEEQAEELSELAKDTYNNMTYEGKFSRGEEKDGWKVTSTGFLVE